MRLRPLLGPWASHDTVGLAAPGRARAGALPRCSDAPGPAWPHLSAGCGRSIAISIRWASGVILGPGAPHARRVRRAFWGRSVFSSSLGPRIYRPPGYELAPIGPPPLAPSAQRSFFSQAGPPAGPALPPSRRAPRASPSAGPAGRAPPPGFFRVCPQVIRLRCPRRRARSSPARPPPPPRPPPLFLSRASVFPAPARPPFPPRRPWFSLAGAPGSASPPSGPALLGPGRPPGAEGGGEVLVYLADRRPPPSGPLSRAPPYSLGRSAGPPRRAGRGSSGGCVPRPH